MAMVTAMAMDYDLVGQLPGTKFCAHFRCLTSVAARGMIAATTVEIAIVVP